MQTHQLLIIIALILLAVAGYSMFAVLRRGRQQSPASPGPIDTETSASIPDSPTYRRTKDYVGLLRGALDAFAESLDLLSLAAVKFGGDSEEMLEIFRSEIPHMYDALVHARNHGEALLAAVQQRTSEPPLDLDVFSDDFRVDLGEICGDSEGAELFQRYLNELRDTVESVAPGIAGFYFALTEQNERHQLTAAVRQVRKVLDRIDYAIDLMAALSKEFTS